MKKLILTLVLFCAVAAQHASAVSGPPYLDDIRSEIINQLTIASNASVLDTKLIKALNKVLTTLDKNLTNVIANATNKLAPGTKVLGLITKALNKTSLSNVFDAPLQQTIDIYTGEYASALSGLSNRLAATFLSSKRTSAAKALGKLLLAVTSADTNMNSNLAVKALGKAATALKSAEKSVVKAENVPPPPAGITATVAVTGSSTVNYKSLTQVVTPGASGNFNVLSGAVTGSGSNTKQLVISFSLQGLSPGANTVNFTSFNYIVTGINGSGSMSCTGTAQVSWDPVKKSLSGTFSCSGTFNFAIGGSAPGTVNGGSFTLYYP